MRLSNASRSLLLSALTLCPSLVLAQGGQAVFRDTVDVEVVNLEVVVTDRDGNPVVGLQRDDFEVFEDGEPVDLTNFFAVGSVDRGATEGPASAARPPLPPSGVDLVIFVDNLTIQPTSRGALFAALRSYLAAEKPRIRTMMLVSMANRIEVVVPFTADRTAILAALDGIEKQGSIQAALDGQSKIYLNRLQTANTASGGPGSSFGAGTIGASSATGNPNFDDSIRVALEMAQTARSLAERRFQLVRASVGSLDAFCSTLGGLPGRKAVLYLGDGLALRPADTLFEAWTEKYENWYLDNEDPIRNHPSFRDAAQIFQTMITTTGSNEFDLHAEIDRLGSNASDNQVVIYPISVAGRGASIVSAESAGSSGAVMRAAQIAEAQTRESSLLQLAADTGGVATTSSANLDRHMDALTDDFMSFYSIGYEPVGKKRDNAFHRIEVKVRGEGLKARHVKGYLRKTWRDRLGEMAAAAALLEVEANPLGVQLLREEETKKGKHFEVPILVQIPFRAIQMVSDGGTHTAEITVLVLVRDEKGGLSKPERIDLPIQIPDAQIAAAREQAAAYPLALKMDAGRHLVAVAVRDHVAETASVVNLEVEVGDASAKGKRGKRRG